MPTLRFVLVLVMSSIAAAADSLPLSFGQTVADTVVHDGQQRLAR